MNNETYKEKALEYHEGKMKEIVIRGIKNNIEALNDLSLEEVQIIERIMKLR
jgi:hypothetical protein